MSSYTLYLALDAIKMCELSMFDPKIHLTDNNSYLQIPNLCYTQRGHAFKELSYGGLQQVNVADVHASALCTIY